MFASAPAAGNLRLTEDCDFGPDAIVASLAHVEPGSDLHSWLAMLEPAHLTENQLLEVGAAWERQRRHDAAIEMALLARLAALPVTVPEHLDPADDRRSSGVGPAQWLARLEGARLESYAAITGQSPVTVSQMASAGELLAADGPLAATGAALATGQLSRIRAQVIADELADVDPQDATRIEAAILPDAELMSRGRLKKAIAARKAALDPKTEQEQHIEARSLRFVSRPMPLPAGMAFLEVLGPADDVQLLHTALTSIASGAGAAARAAARDARTRPAQAAPDLEGINAHRFDALIGWAAAAINDDSLPTAHGRRPAISISMTLSTLLGLDDQPADLAGYGPITAAAARRAAFDPTATWQRLITRPDGLVIDAAYTSYRPPQALCDTVIVRDAVCTFPRCSAPAERCDLDHQEPWPSGETCYHQNHALCRHHHHLKTARIWLPTFDPDTGDTIWTHISGHQVRRPAELRPSEAEPCPPAAEPGPVVADVPPPGAEPCPPVTNGCPPSAEAGPPVAEPCPTSDNAIASASLTRPRILRALADRLGDAQPALPLIAPPQPAIDDDPPPF